MPTFTGRSKELGALRSALDEVTPQIVRLTGMRGAGKSALVRRVLTDYRSLYVCLPPLPDAALRRHFYEECLKQMPVSAESSTATWGPSCSWPSLFGTGFSGDPEAGRTLVLCIDDADRLTEARSRILAPLVAAQRQAAAAGTTVHVVLAGARAGLPTDKALAGAEIAAPAAIEVGTLPLRAAVPHLPGSTAGAKIRAYGVFGGVPSVLAQLDPTVTVGTNVRRLTLDPDGPLASAGLDWIEKDVQNPARYAAILSALSTGEADWSQVHAGVPDLTRSGQVAPYLKRLVELGLVGTRRSLDAGPRSRATRYSLTDPFLAFWFRFVMPWKYGAHDAPPGRHYANQIRPVIDDHLATVFPEICRQHLRHDALETLGASVRESGSLWGNDFHVDAAGILTSGSAYYGVCRWRVSGPEDAPLAELEANIRETRYGFGRERRHRLVFTGRPVPRRVSRDVARHRDAQIIDARALVGD